MTYDVVAGTVNSQVGQKLVKYKSLLRVDDVRPHMVAIIHNDVERQTHVLTLRDLVLDSDPQQLILFMWGYLSDNKAAQLSINPQGMSAMIAAMKQIDFTTRMDFVYTGKVGPINTVRYTNLQSILSLWDNRMPDSDQLIFTFKQ